MNTEISVHKQCVKDLLRSGKDRLFVIPEYQRPYNWTEDEIDTLFDDLWTFSNSIDINSNKTYFLGSVVSYNSDKKDEQEIIDGQQRITSLFLLLRAIYTKLTAGNTDIRTKEEKNFISEIEPTIWRTNKFTGEVNYSEILLRSDVINNEGNEILKKILETGKVDENATDNYSKNYKRLLKLYEEHSVEEPLKIYKFIFTVLNQTILLPISAGCEDTALTIFSTLNDRGLPLSDADIFKSKIYNHLSKSGKENLSKFIETWKTLEDSAKDSEESLQSLFYYYMFYLRAVDEDEKTTTPGLRKYFAEKSYKRLYEENILTNISKILNLWKVVNRRDILEDEKWSENNDILKILDILNSYTNEFWKYPVIIYYLKYSSDDDFEDKFLLFLRRFCSFLLVTYLRQPTINAVKSDIMKLNSSIIKTDKPKFNPLDINNDEFKNILKTPHIKMVRMLLLVMAYLNPKQEERLPEKWEIEHIFPQKWHNNYILNVSDEVIKEKIEHLGNKLPFEKKLNIEACNGYFGKKKDSYKNSKIAVTSDMSKSSFDEWGLNNIEARDNEVSGDIQKELIKWINDYDSKFNDEEDNENKNNNLDSKEIEEMIRKLRENGYEII